MPRNIRFFPVNHDINADPELWEFTDKFGDRALRVWLEILSIADRNKGEIPGKWESYPRVLAGRTKTTTKHLIEVCQWLTRWLSIDSEGVARVRNYEKYHKRRGAISDPPNLTEPNLTPLHQNVTKKPASPEPSAGSNSSRKMDPEIKAAADPVYNSDPVKFARLIVWIKQAEKAHYSKPAIVKSLRDFLPYAGSVNGEWWAYLDKLIYKAEPNLNAGRFEKEHEQRKKAEADIPPHVAQALKGVH